MYIYLKRTSPHPSYNAFDGPERFVCQVKRQNTNTPLQALATLNDPQFMECAVALADKALQSNPNDPTLFVFEAITLRKPSPKEYQIIASIYSSFYKTISKTKADKLIQHGYYMPQNKNKWSELSSLAVVAHTLYNYDEVLNKE